jgi:hypothetical protein
MYCLLRPLCLACIYISVAFDAVYDATDGDVVVTVVQELYINIPSPACDIVV